jgi:amidase
VTNIRSERDWYDVSRNLNEGTPMTVDLHYLSLLDLSEHIRRRDLCSVDIVSALLARIAAFEPRLNGFLHVMGDSALADAKRADAELGRGQWRGPMHGIPIGIKDLIDVAGVPTTSGTEIMKDRVPAADATIVGRLKRAGAIVIGKTHMTEAAMLDHHPKYKRPDNPWKSGFWTGVSSSGSGVSVAAGFCYGALGSDTGGSIRMPSSACGLSGIKPTWGRVSRQGVFPLAETFDHVGPMCRTAADAATMLQIIAGQDPADPTALTAPVPDYAAELGAGIDKLRIGVDWSLLEDRVDTAVAESVRQAAVSFELLGAHLRDVALPPIAAPMAAIAPLMMAEIRLAHADTYPRHADRYGPSVARMLAGGDALAAIDVARAVQARMVWNGRLRRLFDEIDILLVPAAPGPTPRCEELDAMQGDAGALMDRISRYTMPFNVSGSPTLSLPCGFDRNGMPLGLQLVGPHLSEALLCRAGHAFQQATDFHTAHPVLE